MNRSKVPYTAGWYCRLKKAWGLNFFRLIHVHTRASYTSCYFTLEYLREYNAEQYEIRPEPRSRPPKWWADWSSIVHMPNRLKAWLKPRLASYSYSAGMVLLLLLAPSLPGLGRHIPGLLGFGRAALPTGNSNATSRRRSAVQPSKRLSSFLRLPEEDTGYHCCKDDCRWHRP
jgi:hypothetical protein